MDNVFIHKNSNVAYGNEEFLLILPGCRVTLEKRSNGEFRLLHLQADANYTNLLRSHQKPALYEAEKKDSEWRAKFVKNGHIKNKEDRVVAITDKSSESPNDIAEEACPFVSDAPISGGGFTIDNNGFNMHHTLGDGKIGGYKNARQAMNAERDPALNESALLLAQTMYKARDIKGVRWISVQGGSGVLTQAMKILADQGITLEKHAVFFSRPTTSIDKAFKLSQQLKLKMDRDYKKTFPLNPDEFIGGLGIFGGHACAWQRYKHDDDYTALKLTADIVKESSSLKAAGATAVTVGAAVGISNGVSTPALITFIGSLVGAYGLGATLSEAWVPRLYHKIKSKF